MSKGNQYEIGYKKPPKSTQFKKGKSGNPAGRPRKVNREALPLTNIDSLILQEAYRPVTVRERVGDQDVSIEISSIAAVMRALLVSASKGNVKAQITFWQLSADAEERQSAARIQAFNDAVEFKEAWAKEVASCEREGRPIPNPLPHPDDVRIDPRTMTVEMVGPTTPEQKRMWELMAEQKAEISKALADIEKSKSKHPAQQTAQKKERKRLLIELMQLDALAPDEATRRAPLYDRTQHLLRAGIIMGVDPVTGQRIPNPAAEKRFMKQPDPLNFWSEPDRN